MGAFERRAPDFGRAAPIDCSCYGADGPDNAIFCIMFDNLNCSPPIKGWRRDLRD